MTEATVTIDQPGVYTLPVDDYHRDPVAGGSLSSSGARRLLPPSCPAKFRHWVDEGQPPKREFDLGHAAHKLILGAGPELVVIDADSYKTKAAQQARDRAHAEGRVPLLLAELDMVQAMAAALRAHPVASVLLDPTRGEPEKTLVWQDDTTGVWCRALLDYLPYRTSDRRLIIPDYKTCHSAAPDDLPKAMAGYGYHQQLDFYLAGAQALRLDQEPAMVLIFQEKTVPYLITIAQPTQGAMEIARTRNAKARDIYRQCTETGVWPGYGDEVIPLALPAWAEYQHADAEQRGDFDTTEDQ